VRLYFSLRMVISVDLQAFQVIIALLAVCVLEVAGFERMFPITTKARFTHRLWVIPREEDYRLLGCRNGV